MQIPETKYAKSGDLHIAYAADGEGPPDLLCCYWTSHVGAAWDWAPSARLHRRLRTFGRVILFDLPGQGLSDPVSLAELPGIEQWMDYVRVVMDAAGVERAALFVDGVAAGLAIPFAATHPDRVSALILYGACARIYAADGYPFGLPESRREAGLEWWMERWGTGRQLEMTAPTYADDVHERELVGRAERYAASPGVARAFIRFVSQLDVRDVLPTVHVPTLVIHKTGDPWIRAEHGRYLAEHIRNARYVELPGDDHFAYFGDMQAVVAETRSFLEGLPERHDDVDRMLATIMMTDIVDSTKRATDLGDHRWRVLLDQHDEVVREQLARFRGREIRSTGDGFLATFDGTVRAVRCAIAIRETLRSLDIEVRSGVHSGEVESRGEGIDGIAVHIAARVAALAGAGDVLVSQTVKDLTVGADLVFESRGTHALKGVPDEWHVYAVVS